MYLLQATLKALNQILIARSTGIVGSSLGFQVQALPQGPARSI
jgi:hypothetical protein